MDFANREKFEDRSLDKWEGLLEIDQAIRDNRLTEYRIKKAWADPWSRTLSIAVVVTLALFAGFVLYWDLLKG